MWDKIGFSSNRLRSLAVISHFKYITPSSGTGTDCEEENGANKAIKLSISDRCWECVVVLCGGCASFPVTGVDSNGRDP